VVASNVVPFDAIVVEVVQNGQARFSLVIFTVVGLRALVTSGVRPVSKSALVSGWDLGLGSGPEPSVDEEWLQIGTVASIEIAFTSTGPDVLDSVAGHLLLDEFVLLQGLETDGVHAVTSADVAGVEPVDFQFGGGFVQPAEEVVVGGAQRIGPHGVFHPLRAGFGIG